MAHYFKIGSGCLWSWWAFRPRAPPPERRADYLLPPVCVRI